MKFSTCMKVTGARLESGTFHPLPFRGLLTAQAMVELLDHCFFSQGSNQEDQSQVLAIQLSRHNLLA